MLAVKWPSFAEITDQSTQDFSPDIADFPALAGSGPDRV
jgi:hypothetical protein